MLEHLDLDRGLPLAAHTDGIEEVADAGGGEAAAAQRADGGHARVVPAADVAFLDEPLEEALGEDGVREVEARELVLARP